MNIKDMPVWLVKSICTTIRQCSDCPIHEEGRGCTFCRIRPDVWDLGTIGNPADHAGGWLTPWDNIKAEDAPDQTIKADAGKLPLTLVPREAIRAIARIRQYGEAKYGSAENWRQVAPERYRDAAFRHFLAYLDDPKGVDEESGLPHLWHCLCNLAFLCELEAATE